MLVSDFVFPLIDDVRVLLVKLAKVSDVLKQVYKLSEQQVCNVFCLWQLIPSLHIVANNIVGAFHSVGVACM